jgi:carboxylate-amine ligase
MIDFGKQKEVPTRDLVRELLFFIDDVVDDLDSREHINRIYDILDNGTAAQRQLKVWADSGEDPKAVVDFIIEQTEKGLLDDPTQFMPSVKKPSEETIEERSTSHLSDDTPII